MLSVRVGGLEIWGAPYHGGAPHGAYVKRDGFKGFDDMPAGRREAIERPGAHGEFDLPVFRGARVLSIDGLVVARSAFGLAGWRSLITGCGADGTAVDVHLMHQSESLRMSARVIEAAFNDRGERGSRGLADFSLHMVCADPRKYGERQSFSGSSAQVFHRGNFPAAPVVEVSGPRSAPYTISGPGGRQVTVAQSLSAGQTHSIDFATGALLRNGARQLGQVTHFRPWAIPPGRQTAMSISAGSMKVLVDDTYM